jgi:ABC-2 type transport system ATP-binding protein
MSATDNILVIDHLTKKYGDKTAVDDISLTIPRGSFYGLLGPNGAGKSTTIGCTIGTVRITSGRILVDGIDVVTEYKNARRKIGVSAQEFNVDPFTPLGQLIDFTGGYYGIANPARRQRVDELLERFGLSEYKDKQFMQLSGGLKRRAILSRALVHDPELLILDEPTAGIDVEQRHQLWKYLRELNGEGKTIILTSHYLEEVEQLCGEIAIINHGTIVAQGPKEQFTEGGKSLEKRYLEITGGDDY